MVCAYNVVRALLAVGGQAAIVPLITGQNLVSHDTSALQTRQGEPWESDNVDLVGRQTRRRADAIVDSKFYVGQMPVPIVLSLVDDHSEHFDHNVVYPLNVSAGVGMMGACSKLVHTQQLKYSLLKVGAELCSLLSESMVRGRPRKGMYCFTRILAVPSVVNSPAVTGNMSTRRLNRSVNSRM